MGWATLRTRLNSGHPKKISYQINSATTLLPETGTKTKNVYINPLNSLKFVLNKIKKDKLNLDKNFWVFTGSTLGIVPINNKGIYQGEISKLGSVKVLLK